MQTEPIIGREMMDRFIEYLRTGDVRIRSMTMDAPLNNVSVVKVEMMVTPELLEALCKSK